MDHTLEQLIEQLTPDQRWALVDRIVETTPPRTIPELTDAELRELERRYDEAKANPGVGLPWETVRARYKKAP